MTPKSLIEPARHAGITLLRSQTDGRLVDLTRGGNERAFEAIVQRYRRPLVRYCSRLLPPTRAEDAVQQAFLSAHRAIHAGDAELQLRPWLYRIAHNAALSLLRQHGFDHEQVSEEIDGVETPPQAFERGERLRTVVAAVQDLPERQRSAIVLQAVEGRSYDEIATELGVTDGAVRQLLNRARNTLREAAAALTPTGLITRIASGGGDVGVAERVAQVVTGAGGGALVAKAGTALIVAGAVAGGAMTGGLPGTGAGGHRHAHGAGGSVVAAAGSSQPGANGGAAGTVVSLGGHRSNIVLTTRHAGGGAYGGSSSSASGPGHRSGRSGGSGSGHGGAIGSRSGSSGGGGSSGSGSGDHSGSDHSGSDHSGSSDASGSSDHSGSGGGSGGDSSGASDHSGSGHGSDHSSPPSAPASVPATAATPVTTVTPAPDSSGSGKGRSGSSGDSTPEDPAVAPTTEP